MRRVFLSALVAGVAVIASVRCAAAAMPQPWTDVRLPSEKRAALLVRALSEPEKFAQLVGAPGVVPELPLCYGVRHVPGLLRLGVPTLRVTNGPVGVGQNDCVPPTLPGLPLSALSTPASAKATALPSGMAVAASFDRSVASAFGDVLGREARALALQVLEGPGLNLARVPQGGRNFEYFGEDPYLTGALGVAEIRAIQGRGVIAMAKHFVANEQETNRFTVNERIDDRVLHELYLLPFEMAVKEGGVASVMCSYNAVNGPHACEDRHMLTDVLRNQWGFKGYVQSDFFAVHSAAPSLLAGMDHEMPGVTIKLANPPAQGPWFTAANLRSALDAGLISTPDIDRALKRRYTQMFRLGVFDRPVAQTPIDVTGDAAVARDIGERSAVLLKNAGGLLPLSASTSGDVLLVGKAAYAAKAVSGCCSGSSDVIPLRTVTPLEGIRRSLAELGSPATARLVTVADDNRNLDEAVAAARTAHTVIVLAGTLSDEGSDLPSLALPAGQDEMVAALLAANPRTVVVMKDNASTLLPWIDAAAAVLEAWFPGQEDGDVVARLLFGQATPSGKLPVTFPRTMADLPVRSPRQWPGVDAAGRTAVLDKGGDNVDTSVDYSEGLQIGHRWFEAQAIRPLFPFGYGLSYTTFSLSDLQVTQASVRDHRSVIVRVTVRNLGARRGAETPQVYLTAPPSAGEPGSRLVGFEKVWLDSGETRRVTITLDANAANHPFSRWDSAAQTWRLLKGGHRLRVGASVADPGLQALVLW